MIARDIQFQSIRHGWYFVIRCIIWTLSQSICVITGLCVPWVYSTPGIRTFQSSCHQSIRIVLYITCHCFHEQLNGHLPALAVSWATAQASPCTRCVMSNCPGISLHSLCHEQLLGHLSALAVSFHDSWSRGREKVSRLSGVTAGRLKASENIVCHCVKLLFFILFNFFHIFRYWSCSNDSLFMIGHYSEEADGF